MRRTFILIFLLLLNSHAYAYKTDNMHPRINENAAKQATNFIATMKAHGFEGDTPSQVLDNIVSGRTIKEWLETGAKLEDETDCRASNHFHDPLEAWEDAGFTKPVISEWCEFTDDMGIGVSSLRWAQLKIYNNWSWPYARYYFYKALTEQTGTARETNLANTFRALGQIMHLIGDSSVPEHVRNDFHVFPLTLGPVTLKKHNYESWTELNWPSIDFNEDGKLAVSPSIFEQAVDNSLSPYQISALWDLDKYTLSEPNPERTWTTSPIISNIGLAEFTNANFLSTDTIFSEDYPHPAKENTTVKLIEQFAKDGKVDKVWYAQGYTSQKLLGVSYFRDYGHLIPDKRGLYQLDDYVYADYASQLVPRAVAYSTALLEYFFRGQVDAVGQEVVKDGTGNITGITMKIKNSTPNEVIEKPEAGEPGKFVVSYQYTGANGNPKYGVSGEVALKESIASGDTSTSEYTFTFGDDPVPADAGDAKFWLVFRGKLGAEADAVAAKLLPAKGPELVLVPYTYSEGFLEPKLYQFSGADFSEMDGSGVLAKWTNGWIGSVIADLRAVSSNGRILYSHPVQVYSLYNRWIYNRDFSGYGMQFDVPWGPVYDESWDRYGGHQSAVWDDGAGAGGGAALQLVFPASAEVVSKGVCSDPETHGFLDQVENGWNANYMVLNPSDGEKLGRVGYKKRTWNLTNTWEPGVKYQNTGNYMLACAPWGVGPKGATFMDGWGRTQYRMPQGIEKDYYAEQVYPAEDHMMYLNPATLQWEDTGNIFSEKDNYKTSYVYNFSTGEFDLYHSDCPDRSAELLTMANYIRQYSVDYRPLLGMLKDTPLYLEAKTTSAQSYKTTYNIFSKKFTWKACESYDPDKNCTSKERNELWLGSWNSQYSTDHTGTAVLKLGGETLESYSYTRNYPRGSSSCSLKSGSDPSEQYAYECTSDYSNDNSAAGTVPSILYFNSFDTDRGELQLVVTFRKSGAGQYWEMLGTLENPRLYIRGYRKGTIDLEYIKAVEGDIRSGESISNFAASVDQSGKYLLIGYTVFDVEEYNYRYLPTNDHPNNGSAVRKHFIVDLDTMKKVQVLGDASGYDRTFFGFVREAADSGGVCQ